MRTVVTNDEFNKFRIVRVDDLVWIEMRVLFFFWTKVCLNHDFMQIETWYNCDMFEVKTFPNYGRTIEDLEKFYWYVGE